MAEMEVNLPFKKSGFSFSKTLHQLSQKKKVMKIKWKYLLVKTTLWLVVEIIMNLLGIDNLADYGEFMLSENLHQPTIVIQHLSLVNLVC